MSFASEVTSRSQQTISLCYHCHKCTAGCPVVAEMEYGPDRILRMVQMGEKESLLKSHDIWLCASCETCYTRCPNEIDTARVMDALRQVALLEGAGLAAGISEPDSVKFHRLFLLVVQNLGRSHEAALLIAYKLWSMNLLADMDSGLQLFLKGKVPLVPKLVKNRRQVQRLFLAAREHERREI